MLLVGVTDKEFVLPSAIAPCKQEKMKTLVKGFHPHPKERTTPRPFQNPVQLSYNLLLLIFASFSKLRRESHRVLLSAAHPLPEQPVKLSDIDQVKIKPQDVVWRPTWPSC